MLKFLQLASRCLSTYASWFVIGVALWSLFMPSTFAWVQQEGRASIILGIIMLTMGCTLTLQDFKVLVKRPVVRLPLHFRHHLGWSIQPIRQILSTESLIIPQSRA